MSLRITVRNTAGVTAAIEKYGAAVENGIERLVKATALEAMSDVKKRIQSPPKTGKIYKRGKIEHRASAPGEAPATDTGTLVSSIYFTFFSRGPDAAMYAKVQSRLPYAYYLEFGTMNIKPRPAWLPATETARKNLNSDINQLLKGLNR